MTDEPAPPTVDNRLTALRMVVIGLVAGQLVMAAILVFSVTRMNGPLLPDPLVVYGFLALGLLAAVAAVVVGPAAARAVRAGKLAEAAEPTPDALVEAYSAEVFVRAAVLEAPAVLLLVGFFLTAEWLVLAPVPVLLALLITMLPTRAKFDAWAEGLRQAN